MLNVLVVNLFIIWHQFLQHIMNRLFAFRERYLIGSFSFYLSQVVLLKILVLIIGVFLKLEVLSLFLFRQSSNNFIGQLLRALILNKLLLFNVEDCEVNVLVTQLWQLYGLLNQASLSFAVGYIPWIFVKNEVNRFQFLLSHF